MTGFEAQLAEHARALQALRVEHHLPDEWFARPDHIAIKCADSADYETVLQAWLPLAAGAQYVHLNGRRLASLRLLEPLTVSGAGQVGWLEVMEPRPEKAGTDAVGVDHVEFKFADFEAAAKVLDAKGLLYEQQENPGHKWLSILANGHEVKLTNRSLAEVVASELAAGAVTKLK